MTKQSRFNQIVFNDVRHVRLSSANAHIRWRIIQLKTYFQEHHMNRAIVSLIAGTAIVFTSTVAMAAKDIVDVAAGNKDFSTLVTAVKAAGLVDTLKGKGPFTVFAPTNEAFAKIPKADLDALLKDKAKLTAVLTYHVVPAKVMAKDVNAGDAPTVNGKAIKITTDKGVMVNNAKVIKTDIAASNGVIHAIDTVLMP